MLSTSPVRLPWEPERQFSVIVAVCLIFCRKWEKKTENERKNRNIALYLHPPFPLSSSTLSPVRLLLCSTALHCCKAWQRTELCLSVVCIWLRFPLLFRRFISSNLSPSFRIWIRKRDTPRFECRKEGISAHSKPFMSKQFFPGNSFRFRRINRNKLFRSFLRMNGIIYVTVLAAGRNCGKQICCRKRLIRPFGRNCYPL